MRNSLWLVFGGVLWAQGVKLPAELQAWQKVAVTARVTGVVERVLVDRGSIVKEGDLLVEIKLEKQNQFKVKSETARRLIELRGVSKSYDVAAGKFLALKEVDMQVDAGEFVAVVVPSEYEGDRKSTRLNSSH